MIPVELFLDLAASFFADVTRFMRGKPKRPDTPGFVHDLSTKRRKTANALGIPSLILKQRTRDPPVCSFGLIGHF